MSTKTPSFAEAYSELQTLTQEFERGNLDLEVAIPKFKRAAELAKFLKKRLSELENQIEEINVELEKDLAEPQPETTPAADDPNTEDIPF